MGCSSSPKIIEPEEQIRHLYDLKNAVEKTIEDNKAQISQIEKVFQEIDEMTKQIENDIVQYQHSYSEEEKLRRAEIILRNKLERRRFQKCIDKLKEDNENMNNFIDMILSKIEEIKRGMKEATFRKIEDSDPLASIRKEIEHIMGLRRNGSETIMNYGYDDIKDGGETAKDILKELLGNGTDGVPQA